MFGLGLIVIVVALIIGGFYLWARRQGFLATDRAAKGPQSTRRISLLTEAVAYIGAILLLAGGVAAISQDWNSFSDWGRAGIFAGAAAFFFLVGILVWRVREPAIQRLVDVAWLLSAGAVAGAVGLAAVAAHVRPSSFTVLAVGLGISVYSVALWLIRRHALQNAAVFTGLVVTICGIIVTATDRAPSLAFALALWGFGLVWAWLGWKRYAEPIWVTIPCGVILGLMAPSLAAGEHGWFYGIGIATAATAMALSVPLRNTPLLALGTLAMFGYVTAMVVQYFGESLGVPAALAITGILIIGLAIVTARLMRVAHPPEPKEPGAQMPSHRDLPKAS